MSNNEDMIYDKTAVDMLIDKIASIEAECAALKVDARRLDYLESHYDWQADISDDELNNIELWRWFGNRSDREIRKVGVGQTLREAIDRAMQAGEKP